MGNTLRRSSETVKITKDVLPRGPHWDEDHACFEAKRCNLVLFGCEWRWVPRNLKAFEKGEPDKELFDFLPPLTQPARVTDSAEAE